MFKTKYRVLEVNDGSDSYFYNQYRFLFIWLAFKKYDCIYDLWEPISYSTFEEAEKYLKDIIRAEKKKYKKVTNIT
jgi:hypothetical protein